MMDQALAQREADHANKVKMIAQRQAMAQRDLLFADNDKLVQQKLLREVEERKNNFQD